MSTPRAIVLMTRPEPAARQFIADLGDLIDGTDVIYAPLIDITFTGPLPDLDGINGLIFSSKNGVAAWKYLGGPVLETCYTVGDATRDAAAELGFNPMSASGAAKNLVDHIIADQPKAPLLHVHGTHTRGAIAQTLSQHGIETQQAVIYDQPLLPLSPEAIQALAGDIPVIVPLFSPRTAQQFIAQGPFKAKIYIAAMSESVAKPLENNDFSGVVIADKPNSPSMTKAVARLLAQVQMLEGRPTGH
ncbi:uroporphyrinogen-III synthase [Thalassococcus halodurans]|uniref:Uroporphyrinogen-III synthase n=2 Tax=Thalassococcus halodurans TaxID=373675 RepID=A0A1H5Z6Z5_9RHOB|nr:uroporphyrinogen-III synthase [Thalassococcus halodurans]